MPAERVTSHTPQIMLNLLRVRLSFRARSRLPVRAQNFSSTGRRYDKYVRFETNGSGSSPNSKQRDNAIKIGVLGFGLCTAYYVAHLEQVPETGRWRFMDVSPTLEGKIAEASRAEIHAVYGGKILPPNHPLTLHVQRIVQRVLTANHLGSITSSQSASVKAPPRHSDEVIWDGTGGDFNGSSVAAGLGHDQERIAERQWEVVVVNDKKIVNAAASPGLVFVFTGMLPITQDEHGLASVLSHEIGHVVARHVPERISSQKVLFVIASLLELLGLDIFGSSRLMTNFLLELPNSRTQEKEADVIGLRLMSKACYDPTAAPRVFRRLAELENRGRQFNVEFFRTHPLSETRVKVRSQIFLASLDDKQLTNFSISQFPVTQYLEEMLPEALGILAASPECSMMQEQLSAFRSAPAFGDGFE
ncbi:hypothetical protein HGRIS_010654 [Hohenbuehelia grisea]|uniref:Peptidase M48 domain-containing protein n=1 Tax=Hohenbuehelia grisea TaxID=104357 RepID=A0ABR3IXG8_9AGAR